MAAGCAVLDRLEDASVYGRLEALGARLATGLAAAMDDAGMAGTVNRVGSMLVPFLGVDEVTDYAGARRADTASFARVHQAWLEAGILWPPSQFEAGFLSVAHSEQDIDRTVDVFASVLSANKLPDAARSGARLA